VCGLLKIIFSLLLLLLPQAVARLTADNLVFMAKLRAAESAAAAASAERDELVLALEQHKGPWMDEVRGCIIVCIFTTETCMHAYCERSWEAQGPWMDEVSRNVKACMQLL
jgi:hypothetical protein